MNNLDNCPNCGALFVRTEFRDVCEACHKKEEVEFEKVYKFVRMSKNRTATIPTIVEETGVNEDLILKFIKTGRLRTAGNPNIGYPCEKCGTLINIGRLCEKCSHSIRSDLHSFEKENERQRELREKEKRSTYFTKNL